MKHYLGIDPGKSGAFVVLNENSEIVEMIPTPLLGSEYDKTAIIEILQKYDYSHIALENPGIIFGVGKSSMVSLSGCVRLIEGMLYALKLPHTLVAPKEWQKECWKHVKTQKKAAGKGNDTKATSALAATNIWPHQNFKITNKGENSKNYNDGFIDAALLAEYVRRMYR